MVIRENLPAWMTREYLETAHDRDYWIDISSKSNDPIDHITCKDHKYRCRRLKKQLKANFFKEALQDAKGDSSRIWKAIDKAFNTVTRKRSKIKLQGIDDPATNAKLLNDFFIDIGPSLDRDLGPETDIITESVLDCPPLTLHLTDETEIRKIVSGLSISTASGDDGFSPRIIKAGLPVFIPLITHLINKSITCRIVPPKWKHACITPIYKAGDQGEPNNYRPISVLPTISKIAEKVIKFQLQGHLDRNHIVTDCQFGFRKNHSTEACVLSMLNTLYEDTDAGKIGGVIFIDLKKAFDTVSHNILLRKLTSIGISNSSLPWFDSYLRGRTQLTRVSGKSSDQRDISIGVPQGSILGPVLFQIYVNDLPTYMSSCQISMFADDTAIYASAHMHMELELALQDDLHSVSQWLLHNRLSINAKKSKVMLVGTNAKLRCNPELKLFINNVRLENVTEYLYLGVMLDSGLKLNLHVQFVYDKCIKKLGLIAKTRHLFDRQTSRLLYITIVLPVIDYCSSVYMVANQTELDKLQKLQNVALRLINQLSAMCPVYELHHRAKIDTLATRREKAY